jgi:hypothetical protein
VHHCDELVGSDLAFNVTATPEEIKEQDIMNGISSWFGVIAVVLVLATAPISSARERHPEIRAALDALRSARANLQAGAHDFHGHRVAAIRDVDAAIHEAEICMQED